MAVTEFQKLKTVVIIFLIVSIINLHDYLNSIALYLFLLTLNNLVGNLFNFLTLNYVN